MLVGKEKHLELMEELRTGQTLQRSEPEHQQADRDEPVL